MKIKYFSDTDTALLEFSKRVIAETKEINENIYIDIDSSGNLVAMTIEHARQQASLPFLSYEQIAEESPRKPKRLKETFYLTSIPGMVQSIKKGMKTPVEKCDEDPGW